MAAIIYAAIAGILYSVCLVIYRLYLSPLSKYPGPKLAAATLWYEFYYDVVKTGKYTFKIKELHNKYGPIIRISPYELHIDEPDYYEELFTRNAPRNKYEWYTVQFGTPQSAFSSVDHRLHRSRRGALNPFFSKQMISRLEPVITKLIDKLCIRLDEARISKQPLPMRLVWMCFTTDVITLYSMNRSWDHLSSPDFSPLWCQTIKSTAESGHILKQFPILFPVIRAMPDWLLGALQPGMFLLLQFQHRIAQDIQGVIDGRSSKRTLGKEELANGDGPQRTIFHELLESDLPEEEKSLERLWQEGQVVVGAGADTTANTLNTITYHLLANPSILSKLHDELRSAIPDSSIHTTLKAVEQLPYLNAVINEGLRMSHGVSSRLARISPEEPMKFHDWVIPAGVPVGMTSVLMHRNEDIFPDAMTFLPERWLDPNEAKRLDKYLVAFTKGSRQCVGMNLAKAEMYLALATVFRRYDMDLFDTTRRDVECEHDMFLPMPAYDSKGVRVVFK